MKALLLLTLLAATPPWQTAPSVKPQWVGEARPKDPAKLRRIVTVTPSVTEILFALGLESRVVGVSRFDDRPPRVKKLPKVGGFSDPNVESILALRPDLVVAAANAQNRPALEQLSRLGVPVFAVPGNTFADAFHATEALAEVLGPKVKAKGRAVTDDMKAQLRRLGRAPTAKGPKVLIVFGKDPLIVGGPGSLADSALDLLGAVNVAGEGPRPYPTWSLEAVLAAGPDIIVDATGAHGRAQPAPWRGLDAVPAVARGRVLALDLAVSLRPSPLFVDGVAALGEALALPEGHSTSDPGHDPGGGPAQERTK